MEKGKRSMNHQHTNAQDDDMTSKSQIQNSKKPVARKSRETTKAQDSDMTHNSAIRSPVYFPSTFIAPSLVEALSLCFDRVIVYQPIGSAPLPEIQPWVTRGFLDIRTPFEDVIDKKTLMAELKHWRTWGALNELADLSYLKEVGNQIAPVGPVTPKLVSEIKGTAGSTKKNARDRDIAVQLFLLLAQDLDQQSWEIREQLSGFKQQHKALQDFFRIDKLEESVGLAGREPFPESNEDLGGFMIENRMVAWNHLFQKDPDESGLLFTDSPVAHAWLVEPAEKEIELLEFKVPCTQPTAKNLPWKDPLIKLFCTLLATPWTEQLRQTIEQARLQIGKLIESRKQPVTKRSEQMASFRWHLLPNQGTLSLLNRRRGLESGSDGASRGENTIIGIVEHGC